VPPLLCTKDYLRDENKKAKTVMMLSSTGDKMCMHSVNPTPLGNYYMEAIGIVGRIILK
jgi:hypothetical protein